MKQNQLDEMQEQKMLQIEHNGYWLAFWGLLAVILLQLLLGCTVESLLGEWVIYMAMCVYLVAGCLRHGLWDRRLTPNPKTNFLFSLLAGVVVWIVFMAWMLLNGHSSIKSALLFGGILGGICFLLCLIALALASKLYRKRRHDLETE